MITPDRLETSMRQAAEAQYEKQELPPFVLFFHRSDPLRFFNYARPLRPFPPGDDDPRTKPALAALIAAYEARGRLPRFEFVAEYAPGLPEVLRRAGFVEEARQHLMVCGAADFRPPLLPAGAEVRRLRGDSPDADLRAYLTVQRRGFGGQDEPAATETDAAEFRRGMSKSGLALLLLLDGEPACAGGCAPMMDGLTELVGVATLPVFRRRGLATTLSGAAVATQLAAGAEAVFLTAEDARAGRIYERVGFRPVATSLAYARPG